MWWLTWLGDGVARWLGDVVARWLEDVVAHLVRRCGGSLVRRCGGSLVFFLRHVLYCTVGLRIRPAAIKNKRYSLQIP